MKLTPVFDEFGLVEKIANNLTNREVMNLNPLPEIKKILEYYRSLFGKIQDLNDTEVEKLKQNVTTFFNLKPLSTAAELPKFFVRISNNNRILKAQRRELGYLTDIDQLLAPPAKFCNYGRNNVPGQRITYCAFG
ncbi:hypothetical protein [Mucilaginibacter sp. BT774]|uniref:hypothetical protein n=1 Tax=Mucilaginibacter sp. BT774 TaxID=3062276 RepID=UPI00267615AA|nr:hypothetical protein [Mucilaginibacter sp. BT774]MDO3626213.1 hypothetical protein [Mucilaginibacter sp. BT774]